MNGLKETNDQLGHDIGDGLLRRVGNILNQAITNTAYTASRIGGDEFVILMPGADEANVLIMLQTIQELLISIINITQAILLVLQLDTQRQKK